MGGETRKLHVCCFGVGKSIYFNGEKFGEIDQAAELKLILSSVEETT